MHVNMNCKAFQEVSGPAHKSESQQQIVNIINMDQSKALWLLISKFSHILLILPTTVQVTPKD